MSRTGWIRIEGIKGRVNDHTQISGLGRGREAP